MAHDINFSRWAERLASRVEEIDTLTVWLREWSEMRHSVDYGVHKGVIELDGDTVMRPESGQLRAITHEVVPEFEGCQFLAVLCEWDCGMWIVAPFSRYSVPAVRGELDSGVDLAGLDVLQLWNCRSVQDVLLVKMPLLKFCDDAADLQVSKNAHSALKSLKKSSNVSQFVALPEETVRTAQSVFRREFFGTSRSNSDNAWTLKAVGDPRNGYIDESIERVDGLTRQVISMYESGYIGGLTEDLPSNEPGRGWIAAEWKPARNVVDKVIPKIWIVIIVILLAIAYAMIKEWLFGGM